MSKGLFLLTLRETILSTEESPQFMHNSEDFPKFLWCVEILNPRT